MKTRRFKSVPYAVVVTILAATFAEPLQAQQASMQFAVARDNSIDGWNNHSGYGDPPVYDKTLETEEWSNFGGAESIRARKANQHAVIMDWDTDAINAFLAANVDTTQPTTWTLNVYPVGADFPPDDVPIETLESLNDWSEGNGPGNYGNFNWDEDTTASTANFAQTAFMEDDDGDRVLDPENSLPWVDDDTGTGGIDDNQYAILEVADGYSRGTRVPNFINSEMLLSADVDDALANGTYASVPLDADLVNAILTDPNNRGIIFGSIPSYSNWQIYSRENDGLGGVATELPGPYAAFLEVTYTPGAGGGAGDFDGDGDLDSADIEALSSAVRSGSTDTKYDVNDDNLVNDADRTTWVETLKNTYFGDANLDGQFNSGDFVDVFTVGKYETGAAAQWNEGDWDGDAVFGSSDFVKAFQAGGYEAGPRAAVSSVPEPSLFGWLVPVAAWFAARRRRV